MVGVAGSNPVFPLRKADRNAFWEYWKETDTRENGWLVRLRRMPPLYQFASLRIPNFRGQVWLIRRQEAPRVPLTSGCPLGRKLVLHTDCDEFDSHTVHFGRLAQR